MRGSCTISYSGQPFETLRRAEVAELVRRAGRTAIAPGLNAFASASTLLNARGSFFAGSPTPQTLDADFDSMAKWLTALGLKAGDCMYLCVGESHYFRQREQQPRIRDPLAGLDGDPGLV